MRLQHYSQTVDRHELVSENQRRHRMHPPIHSLAISVSYSKALTLWPFNNLYSKAGLGYFPTMFCLPPTF